MPPADINRSAIAWKRRKSLSDESFTFHILNTRLLKLVVNKGKPSWQIKCDIPETESFANIRFHKDFKQPSHPLWPKYFWVPVGPIGKELKSPIEKLSVRCKEAKGWHSLTWRVLPFWQDLKHVLCFADLKQIWTSKPDLLRCLNLLEIWPDFNIMIEQVLLTCHGRGRFLGFSTHPVWFCTGMYSFPL